MAASGATELEMPSMAACVIEDTICRIMTRLTIDDMKLTDEGNTLSFLRDLVVSLASKVSGAKGHMLSALDRPLAMLRVVMAPKDNMDKLQQVLTELAAIAADPGCQEQESAVLLHLVGHATGKLLTGRAQSCFDDSGTNSTAQ